MKPSSPPTSAPVIREPTAWVTAPGGPFFSVTLAITGPSSWANPSAFAWIHAGRSTTSTGAVRAPASSPVKSRTYDVERSAPARSSSTVAAASLGDTCGPAPAIRDPRDTARPQSTISVVMSRAYGPDGVRALSDASPGSAGIDASSASPRDALFRLASR